MRPGPKAKSFCEKHQANKVYDSQKRYRCKQCINERHRRYMKSYRVTKKDLIEKRNQVWMKLNASQLRDKQLQRDFGINIEQYQEMLIAQGGVCAICGKGETSLTRKGKVRGLAVDHDHQTGQIRGLLCSRCNQVLGRVEDNVDILQSMIDYLEAANADI